MKKCLILTGMVLISACSREPAVELSLEDATLISTETQTCFQAKVRGDIIEEVSNKIPCGDKPHRPIILIRMEELRNEKCIFSVSRSLERVLKYERPIFIQMPCIEFEPPTTKK